MERSRKETYCGSLLELLRKYEKYARADRFTGTSREEFRDWQEKSRKTLAGLLGMEKMERPAPRDLLEERAVLADGIVREKWWIRTEPNVDMPCYILIPQRGNGTVFLALHGHNGGGKESVAGRREDADVAWAIDHYHYDYGYQLAKLGYVAVCPDSRGFGERRAGAFKSGRAQTPRERKLGSACYQLTHMAEGMGETLAGMMLWDNMALIDYLERRGEWDLSNLGCLGFSGGGMQTLWLAAMDGRIRQAYISGYLYGVRDSLLVLSGNCSCNYVPHLWEHFDMGDIASLIAPRPLMVQSCRDDDLNGNRGMENVEEQMRVLRGAYQLCGVPERLVHDVYPGPHRWHGDKLEEITKRFCSMLRGEDGLQGGCGATAK